MVSDDRTQEQLAEKWNRPSYWSPAIGRRGGVAILISPRQREKVSVWQRDAEGRLLSLLISFDTIRINLVNIYTPTYPAERGTFFQSLEPYFFPNSRLILAGDFNCYDSVLDKMGGSVTTDSRLTDLKTVKFLRDAWRLKHLKERQHTWFNSDLSIASRLDTFLNSRFLCAQVVSCEFRPCVYSDHEFVFLELNLHLTNIWGSGVWKFNNSLLQDEKFSSSIGDLIDVFLSLKSSFSSDSAMWELLKHEIKNFTIRYSREKWRQLSREKISVFNRLSLLKCRLAAGCESVKSEILQLEVF